MLVKASVARSPNQLAQHVRQKVLVAAVARGVPTINDLLKRADEDKSGALSYKEFYTTLRKLLQLTAAAVTDDAVRQTFKVIDKKRLPALVAAQLPPSYGARTRRTMLSWWTASTRRTSSRRARRH